MQRLTCKVRPTLKETTSKVNHVQDEVQVKTIINKPLEWDDDKKCYTRNLEGKGDESTFVDT